MYILAVFEQAWVPIEIQAFEMLYDLLKADPKGGGVWPVLRRDTVAVVRFEAVP
tara:strand:- start:5779 stop:5940 length:162 start_codon:yes stop_codon:yes gene_type:complete